MQGAGEVTFDSLGPGHPPVTWPSRAEEPNGRTSPEELIAAAHATCYSMALSHGLAGAGTPATSIDASAEVTFVPGTGITQIALAVVGRVPGLDAGASQTAAEAAKTGCPVSKALAAVPISLAVTFVD